MEDEKKEALEGKEVEEPEKDETDYKAKYEAMKSHSREWEKKAKANQDAAEELEKLKDENRSEIEKANSRAQKAEEEAAKFKAEQERRLAISKVADANKVPVEFVSMLSGADEDELTDQVKRALEILPAYPTRSDDGGGSSSGAKKTNADRFFDNLFE